MFFVKVEFATAEVGAMYIVSLVTAMKVRRECEVCVRGYGTSARGCGVIWYLCGKIWEDIGAQDDMEPGRMWKDMGAQDAIEALWENTGGYGGRLRTIWNLCGRIWKDIRTQDDMISLWENMGGYGSSGRYGTSAGGCVRIWQLRTIWYLCVMIYNLSVSRLNLEAQDDMENLWEVVGGYGSSGRYGTSVGGCGRNWQLRTIWDSLRKDV